MKTQTESKFFEPIIESYINGNISWVKEQVKKLSKANRKMLYKFSFAYFEVNSNERWFFFELI